MTRIPTITIGLVTGLLLAIELSAAESKSTAGPTPYPERMAWWGDARFGLFVHWGPVSLKGTEIGWSRGGERRGYGSKGNEVPVEVYDNLYKEFNPTNFNAREWVAIAKAAGMKYLVFTSRHHDGFSMFDTKANDYKITNPQSPFRRDVVKELADACHEAGLRFGLYYSQPNWQHPDAFTPDRHDKYLAYLKQQVTELCSNYGQLDILWFDGLGKTAKDYDGEGLVKIIRGLQPQIIINNRTGLPEDHDTSEQRVGKHQDDRPWESCITICRQWAWKPNDAMKSLQECLRTLVLCAGGDGNLLFNVGPMPDGRIEPRQIERLKEVGAWLAKNGESIYGTRSGPWKPTKAVASTRKGNAIYVHVFEWDGDRITLPNIGAKVIAARLLDGGEAGFEQNGETLVVTVAPGQRQAIDTVVRLDLDRSAMILPSLSLPSQVRATASNTYQRQEEYGPEQAFDDDPQTRWATDGGTRQAWIARDFGKPVTLAGVRIHEAVPYDGRVKQFEFQIKRDAEWQTLFTGTTLGTNFTRSFPAVTATAFRLNILDATDGPTISEIQGLGDQKTGSVAPKPLYRDPVHDGAADPSVIWNPHVKRWWMFYTNRRANLTNAPGVSWVHGTRLGIAESADGGVTWKYVGTADIELPPEFGGEQTTHWAPEVMTAPDGTHHMFLSVVPGIFENWDHARSIVHLTSDDLRHWTNAKPLKLASDRVIDACILQLPDGGWRLWYNNERDRKSIYYADSPDLVKWTDKGKAVGDQAGEGPKVFRWHDAYWMVTDVWRGLAVYRSEDALTWTRQPGQILEAPGKGEDDGVIGGHPDVVVCGDRAFLFYFTHPGRHGPDARKDGYEQRRSSIQVVELKHDNGRLTCNRDEPTQIRLVPPSAPKPVDGGAASTFPVNIRVDASKLLGELKPVWRFFGADEPNYAYMKNGRKLLGELGALRPNQVFFRAHNLLTSGDGTPALKWGSSGVYREDEQGKPVYDWTILDRIFDTYRASDVRPYAQIGFMPKDLSIKPEPYQHKWTPTAKYDEIYTGWAYPPKDYAKWATLVDAWVKHCVERYGQAEVEKWYWEVWNEPNIGYWRGTREEFLKLHDYANDAVRRALPTARVGGPDVAGSGGKFSEAFFEHCLRGTNFATGRVGTPLDFVSFHAKGSPVYTNGHVRMGIAAQLRTVNDGFRIIASFPELKGKPIVIGESDPEGCAACQGPQLGYRNSTMYSSYTAASFARIQELAERQGVNLEGVLTWAFTFEDQPLFAGFRQLATGGLDLPVLNVFRMLGQMSGQRLAAQSDAAVSLDDIMRLGVRARPDISAVASSDGKRLCVLLWHYHDDDVPAPAAEVNLTVSGLAAAARNASLKHYRVDENHSNAYTAWQKMNSPASPTEEQMRTLETAGQLAVLEPSREIAIQSETSVLTISLPRQAVSLLVLDLD